MDFALSEEQTELAATVRGLLDKRADSAAVRTAAVSDTGHDEALWATLCEQIGVAALNVPESYDGVGASFFESAVVLAELGRSLAPSPLLASVVAVEALLAGGTEDAKARLLPRIAAGEIATVALPGSDVVLDADRAAIVLVVDGDDLVEVTGACATWVEAMDQSIRLARLDLSGAERTVVGNGRAALARAELVGAAAVAALAVGLSDRALAMTVDYSKERVQFGRPIGSFQALKHRMADVFARAELARSASWAASYALAAGEDAEDTAFRVRAAASYCLEAASLAASECVQLHGGIAITWEHDAQLVFKRAHALGRLFGAPHQHRAAISL
ncbi:acyl-CoA dehydrogenase family protein [Nocardioides sp. zg-536]|uniref:Acyl-CoA dehydrogenase family protein n=1 Tax=Nocardioides faecalis TaxID=2803858 RepID=A0A938Y428_9ACTN|nr:acyl-CoA dehydrogenase family protein [Nocardioides faecalis]MBM9458870.1 acyl-CoA dehydrogenase family protein [Nocardioides faecalis]QVI60274.1 acyl-CoA dehydrogenase family protein [Nocardioides faecalis]